MRNLTEEELSMITGADTGLTVSAETVGGAAGGGIGAIAGLGAGAGASILTGTAGIIVGAAAANYLINGKREIGSVGLSGIPYGSYMGPPVRMGG
ncbi:hypothetical protein [Pseudomonas sp. Leaf127]|uniref:hypothetical protein n=1 Tax=Pseudomonas sp. Leaf127 TaxID=1736267 RepID=UPI0009E79D6C|nr:hypothetical protein [Pseudomonas sp. Leaf127]